MGCYKHSDREATVKCSECGRFLCEECGRKISPPLCENCAAGYAHSIKSEMIKNIGISILLMIVGIVVIQSPAGALLAGIPYGWSILNKMTPNMFLWLPLLGWLIYFFVKLILAYIIGIPALIIKLTRWITELSRVNRMLKSVGE